MRISLDTFVISDWHFGHKSVVKFANRPQNHEELIINRCNQKVGKYSTLLFLGDFTFVNKEKTAVLTQKIRCTNKFIVLGNHDTKGDGFYQDLGFKSVFPVYKRLQNSYGQWFSILFTHEPIPNLPPGFLNIHGHIHRGTHRDGSWLTPQHINVSCEVLDFYPVTIRSILDRFITPDHLALQNCEA